MFNRRHIEMFVVLLCCTAASADPFAPAQQPPADGIHTPAANYRVVGTAILEARTVAIIHVADGRFRVVKPGDDIGDVKVITITLDAVHVETSQGMLRWPVTD